MSERTSGAGGSCYEAEGAEGLYDRRLWAGLGAPRAGGRGNAGLELFETLPGLHGPGARLDWHVVKDHFCEFDQANSITLFCMTNPPFSYEWREELVKFGI